MMHNAENTKADQSPQAISSRFAVCLGIHFQIPRLYIAHKSQNPKTQSKNRHAGGKQPVACVQSGVGCTQWRCMDCAGGGAFLHNPFVLQPVVRGSPNRHCTSPSLRWRIPSPLPEDTVSSPTAHGWPPDAAAWANRRAHNHPAFRHSMARDTHPRPMRAHRRLPMSPRPGRCVLGDNRLCLGLGASSSSCWATRSCCSSHFVQKRVPEAHIMLENTDNWSTRILDLRHAQDPAESR